MNFGTVAILGPGLIGGSLALALAERKLTNRLVIYARSQATLTEVKASCPLAELTTDPEEAIKDADVVVLCLPIESLFKFVCPIAHLFKPSALVTDVGSVKGSVERDLAPLLAPNAHWIGSHPMAGSEKSGFSAARPDLFNGATVVLTPTDKTSLVATNRATEFWQALGGHVVNLSAETHDSFVAEISHLPHLVAAALVNHSSEKARELSGGGFRDTTRIASGSPDLWVEILTANAGPLIKHIDGFIAQLLNLRFALNSPTEQISRTLLLEELKKAQLTRSQLLEKKPSSI